MASLIKLLKRKDELVEEVYHRINIAEEARQHEYESALHIQAWYRGQRVRAYLKFLDKNALNIQCSWRSHIALKTYREKLKRQLQEMKIRHYNAMATKIQKVWHGFYSRKHIFNYYSRKRYLEAVVAKNETIRTELEELVERRELQEEIQRDREAKTKLDTFVKEHHYLISTDVIPGVYNSPFKLYPNEMEFHLKHVRSVIAKDKITKKSTEKQPYLYDPSWKQYNREILSPLPPVHKRPQGPFREPHTVRHQRYRPFNPTLRVETDYFAVDKARQSMKDEEWTQRLHDDTWMPPSPVSKSYQRLLHGYSKFGALPYGSKSFREELPEKFIVQQNFKTLVPPIPVFDKLNQTYSMGEV